MRITLLLGTILTLLVASTASATDEGELLAGDTPGIPFELDEAESTYPSLDLYGFADFNYRWFPLDKDNGWAGIFGNFPSFYIGNFALYLDSQIAEDFRTLSEIRFLFFPNGSFGSQASIGSIESIDRVNTSVADYAAAGLVFSWGSILIERAWIEWFGEDWLKIRGGLFLTPYGVWNVDHGSPVTVPIQQPFVIRDQYFPRQQSGIQIHGTYPMGSVLLGYHATLSNGRNPFSNYEDLDANPGLGARIYANTRLVGDFTIGASIYRGRYTERGRTFDPTTIEIENPVSLQLDELSLGGDLRFEVDGLLVQGEVVFNEIAFVDPARPKPIIGPAGFVPDGSRWGFYGLLGYRFDSGLMPWVFYEHTSFSEYGASLQLQLPALTGYHAGLNYYLGNLVLKTQFGFWKPDSNPTVRTAFDDRLSLIQFQTAWTF